MLSLRLREGINRKEFQANFQQDPGEIFKEIFTKYCKMGLLNIEEDRIQLTVQGLYLSDSIFAELFD